MVWYDSFSITQTNDPQAKENLLLGALAFRGTTGILELSGGSSDRDGAENYKGGKLHLERAKGMNTTRAR